MSAIAPGPNDGPPVRDPGTHPVKAVAVTLVAVLIAVLLLNHAGSASSVKLGSTPKTTPKSGSSKTTTTLNIGIPTTTTQPPLPPAQVRLQVLNGVGRGLYAGEFSTKLHTSPGYDTLAPDNATATVGASAIYIVTVGYLPEAKALATTLGLPASVVVQTTPPPSTAPIPAADLAKADLVLVVGPDLVAKA